MRTAENLVPVHLRAAMRLLDPDLDCIAADVIMGN